jgi:hypothetical protein
MKGTTVQKRITNKRQRQKSSTPQAKSVSARAISARRVADEMRILMFLNGPGGYHYRTIAAKVFGKNPSDADIDKVGYIARRENLSPRRWRNAETTTAQDLLAAIENGRKKKFSLPL